MIRFVRYVPRDDDAAVKRVEISFCHISKDRSLVLLICLAVKASYLLDLLGGMVDFVGIVEEHETLVEILAKNGRVNVRSH